MITRLSFSILNIHQHLKDYKYFTTGLNHLFTRLIKTLLTSPLHTMKNEQLTNLPKLRVLIAFLGEKDQHNWWPSSFFSKTSDAFLKPIFPKTSFLAKVQGCKAAATIVHDEHIGIGKVYHLFRFPESVERDLSGICANTEVEKELLSFTESHEMAIEALNEYCNGTKEIIEGPIKIDSINQIHKKENLALMANYYKNAFDKNKKVYPYFVSD